MIFNQSNRKSLILMTFSNSTANVYLLTLLAYQQASSLCLWASVQKDHGGLHSHPWNKYGIIYRISIGKQIAWQSSILNTK